MRFPSTPRFCHGKPSFESRRPGPPQGPFTLNGANFWACGARHERNGLRVRPGGGPSLGSIPPVVHDHSSAVDNEVGVPELQLVRVVVPREQCDQITVSDVPPLRLQEAARDSLQQVTIRQVSVLRDHNPIVVSATRLLATGGLVALR